MKLAISLVNNIREKLLPADIIDVLRHRDFKLLFAATVAANLGDAFYFVALPWLVLAYGGSATAVGLTGAAAMLPYVLLGPLAGVISDRVNRKNLMIAADLARALIIAVLVAAGWLGLLQSWHFAITAFLLTGAGLFIFPARGALIPSLVPKQELVAANAAMSTGFQMMNIAGKAAGGFLILAIGPIAAMGLCGATYVVSSILISRMAAPPACGARANGRTIAPRREYRCRLTGFSEIHRTTSVDPSLSPYRTRAQRVAFSGDDNAVAPAPFGLGPGRTGGFWTLLGYRVGGCAGCDADGAPVFAVGWRGASWCTNDSRPLGGLVVLLAMATHVWQVLALAMLMGVVTAGGRCRWEVLFRPRRRMPTEAVFWQIWRLLVLLSSL